MGSPSNKKRPFQELKRARVQLRLAIIIFAIVILVPLCLLVNHTYATLENDALLKSRLQGDDLISIIRNRVDNFISEENLRPASHYEFFTLATNQLMKPVNVAGFSPLANKAQLGPSQPGFTGYFQIAPDGKRTTPLLPDADLSTIATQTANFESKEFDARLEAWKKVQRVLDEDSELLSSIQQIAAKDDELHLLLSPSNQFILARQILQAQKPFIQGLVIEPKDFLEAIVLESFRYFAGTTKPRVTILRNNQLLGGVVNGNIMLEGPNATTWLEEVSDEKVIRSVKLSAPLEDVELRLSIPNFADLLEHTAVNQLAAALIIVLAAGTILIYKLSNSHLALVEERTNFVSAVSHELKTPLTSIRMYGELLKEGWVSDESKRASYYEYICRESDRLSRLISNVLEVSKLSNRSEEVKLAPLTSSDILTKAEESLKNLAARENFELKVEPLSEELKDQVMVIADGDAISQVLFNLVDNAIKFSKSAEEKKVIVGFRLLQHENGSELHLFVRDFGPGVPSESKKKIFELFYRGQNELTRTAPGTGIGLALVKELCEEMGARVNVVDANPGSEFQISFIESTIPNQDQL